MRGAIHALAKGRGRVLAKLAAERAEAAKKGD
jgi:tRNA/rRNA methyltransferase